MPLCIVPIAFSLTERTIRTALLVLAVPQVLIDLVVWQHPRWLWPTSPGINPALHEMGPLGRSYESALPTLREPFSSAGHIAVVVMVIAAVSATLYLAARSSVAANPGRMETSA
jgi:hypothetical protein